VLDADGNLALINQKATQVSGYQAEEIVGKIFTKTGIVTETSLPVAITKFASTVTGQTVEPFHMEIEKKSGERAVLEAAAEPLRVEGSVRGAIVVLRDISFRGK
jgi:PAS domain S-box-containing protein